MDGSDSMRQAGNYGRKRAFFFIELGEQRNAVQDAMQMMVPYLAQKDADGQVHVAYWAAGKQGKEVQQIGEMTTEEVAAYQFAGPETFGGGTYLLPAVRNFVSYMRNLTQQQEVKATLGCFITDGQIHDFDQVIAYTQELAGQVERKNFPRTTLVLVGVGPDINHEQMEQLADIELEGYTGRDIWCCEEAESMDDLPGLVAHLLDANTPAFWGGAVVKDQRGQTVLAWEDMVPAVFEFELPARDTAFTLQVGDQTFTQRIDIEEEH
jgi:acid stress-induced BolA-like protein IbaG/YrbA